MGDELKEWLRGLFGPSPRAILHVLAPTLLAVVLDLALRGRALAQYPPFEAVNYFGSILLSAALWGGPLWLVARMRRALAAIVYALWIFPLAAFSFGGQALHYRVFHSYMARDTVRLGIAVRGTVGEWLAQLGGAWSFVAIGGGGLALTIFFAVLVRRAAPALAAPKRPWIPAIASALAFGFLFFDLVESRALQSATPDACFAHGVVHALRDGITGKGWVRRGVSVRTPAPLPPLTPAAHRPNVIVIVTESVRADAMCSARTDDCVSRFLDDAGVARDRVALGRLTTQSPGTLSACMLLWTGLPPTASFAMSHRAPVLWEVARAVGYRTIYVTSQSMQYEDFGLFVQRAGIDDMATAVDLGDLRSQQIGAPDERATARLLESLRAATQPTFSVLHLSNTHAPYRTEPDLEPFAPHAKDPLGDVALFHNHYRNSVLLQERTIAAFLRDLRALASFEDTVVLFLSDHGEQFREHGGLYHIHSLFEEEVRVPGWLVAGPRALDDAQRRALEGFATRRTYSQDVHATILDLLGVLDQRASMPFESWLAGRSLLRATLIDEPIAALSTATGVWEPDVFLDGVIRGDVLLAGPAKGGGWKCWRMSTDPAQQEPGEPATCGSLVNAAWRAFPTADIR